MNYQVRHESFFMEFIHNFSNLKSVADFIKGSNFQIVKEFEIFAFSGLFEELALSSLNICKNGKWNLIELVTAANVEFLEIVKDFDEYEFRNNFDENDFLVFSENLTLPGFIEVIDFWIENHELDESIDIEEKCKRLKNAVLEIGKLLKEI